MARKELHNPNPELHYKRQSTQVGVSNKKFFDGLSKNAKILADRMAHARAIKMQQILIHRWLLGSAKNGRFPRWQPVSGEHPKKSNKAFEAWKVSVEGDGVYSLHNGRTNKSSGRWQGYSYVRNLATGEGWGRTVRASMWSPKEPNKPNRLIQRGGRIFSKQMPFGLSPWLNEQREKLKKDIKEAYGDMT